jgi:hypothetical protein
MVGAGKADGAMDAGNMLKPALARGDLHCMGATTLDEYRQYIEKDAINGFIRQLPVGNVSDGIGNSSDNCRVSNFYAMMHFIFFL